MTVTTPDQAPAAEVPESSGTRLVDRVFKMRELAILVVFLVMIAVTQAGNSEFLSEQGIKDLLLNATILVLVATGQSLVVITRNVDLSVGSTLGISAFAAGTYLHGGGNPVTAIVLAVLLGVGCGLLNGLLVSLGQVPALVVTLGTLYIIRGIDSIWVGSRQITAADLPGSFVDFGSGGLSAVPYLALIALAVLIATAYYLKHFGSGRELYALGSNPEAARLAGIPVRKRILAAYTFCGGLAGLAGALYLARFGNVDSGTGNGYELTVVSAVVVGGVVFTGGSGSVYGAALGALLLTSINSVLPALGVSSVWVLAINGVLLLLAIAVDRIVALRVAAALKKKSASARSAAQKGRPVSEPGFLANRVIRRSAFRWDGAVGAVLIVLLLLSFSFVDGFGNSLNLSFLIGNTLPIALIALPMTLLVVSGEIDLSVASTAGLSGAVMGALWNQGMTIETIIPLCLLLGVVCGLINGLLVTRLGLPSLAVTIGTMAAYRGIAQIVLGSDAVTDFPTQYLDFAAGRLGDTFLPQAVLPFVVLLAIAVVVLHATPFGRSLFAIGASEEAARFAGIRVKRQKLILFTVTGLMASLTGVFWALHYASARYDNATGLELSVIAAVLLGGIDFDGGKGTLGGAIAGVFLLGAAQNVMSLQDVSAQSQIVVTGVLLVVSVLGPRVARQISVARAARSAG